MKKMITILAAFSGLFLVNGCSKEAPAPDVNPIEQTSLLRGTCRQYWAYDGGQYQNLGNLLNSRIVIGFKKGTNQAKKLKVISEYPQLNTIINSKTLHGDDHTDVSLKPNLTCAQVGDLLDDLAADNHVDYVGPYFIGNFGIANTIEVILDENTTQAQFNNLLRQTKTEYVRGSSYGAHYIKTTRHSPKNCLETANQLYETGLFYSAIPDWSYFIDD